ncbi:hypothetical protein BU26DRAFT_518299 [Trematosphaeria pertusa]|uniref:Autophagy-related protein 1 n=1 Tax=Trematosphaeria pertusa TaxID=390896 RepID=A0A6A6IH39_9PLEO|nr:uncharacterized protein BU26DRAFT_518299 [Trematosphaeria pertusa]KAF2249741.1 hypothetical protein BU26DRAFT_518299 [Trematosphaeria pertusa]
MAALPRFVFPPRHSAAADPESGSDTSTLSKDRPQIHLQTPTREEEGFSLSVPGQRHSPPEPLRTSSTPPDSPTRQRSYTMGSSGPPLLHDSGAVTPPPTPTGTTHSKSHSASSIASSLSSLRRGDSTSSTRARSRRDTIDESEKPGSTQPRKFPYWLSEYEIEVDEKGKKTCLGSGLWSDVYLAKPCLPNPVDQVPSIAAPGAEMTPPITPVHSRASSLSKEKLPQVPPAYAIKVSASRSAKQVLGEESRILSHIVRFPDAEQYVVSFYGQDTRTEALVLKAMDGTLEGWVQKELNALPEPARVNRLAEVFPVIAAHLLDGLAWIQDKGCTHADIKPSNILVSAPSSFPSPSTSASPAPHTVYSDFSSALLPSLPSPSPSSCKPKTPLGGGTWDFLDPTLLSKSAAPISPSPETDLWSLAITLLSLVLGASPFDCAGANQYRRREFIKQGVPLSYAAYGDDGARNLNRMAALSRGIGLDVQKWFAGVLSREVGRRVGLAEWRAELERAEEKEGVRV